MFRDTEIVLTAPVRTAIGAFNGSLKGVPATDLGACVVKEILRRTGLPPAKVESAVFGNVIQAGNGMNPARQASINGGLSVLPRPNGEPRMRLRRASYRNGRSGSRPRHCRCRNCRWDGEHGPRAISSS